MPNLLGNWKLRYESRNYYPQIANFQTKLQLLFGTNWIRNFEIRGIRCFFCLWSKRVNPVLLSLPGNASRCCFFHRYVIFNNKWNNHFFGFDFKGYKPMPNEAFPRIASSLGHTTGKGCTRAWIYLCNGYFIDCLFVVSDFFSHVYNVWLVYPIYSRMPVWLFKVLILRGLSLNEDFVSKYSISICMCLTKWWLENGCSNF